MRCATFAQSPRLQHLSARSVTPKAGQAQVAVDKYLPDRRRWKAFGVPPAPDAGGAPSSKKARDGA